MPENEVDIGIRVHADPKSVQDLSKAVKAMETQLSHVPESMKKVDEASKKTDETTKKLTGKFGDLKSVARGLAFEFPLLGRAVTLLANPIAGAIALAVTAGAAFKAWFDELDASLKASQQLAEFTKTLDSTAVSTHKLKTAAKEHAVEMAKIGVSLDPVGDAYAKLIKRLETVKDLQATLITQTNELNQRILEAGPGTVTQKARAKTKAALDVMVASDAVKKGAMAAEDAGLLAKKVDFEGQQRAAGEALPGLRMNVINAERAEQTAFKNTEIIFGEQGAAQKERDTYSWWGNILNPFTPLPSVARRQNAERLEVLKRAREMAEKQADTKQSEAKTAREAFSEADRKEKQGRAGALSAGKEIADTAAARKLAAPTEAKLKGLAVEGLNLTEDIARTDEANRVLKEAGFDFQYQPTRGKSDSITQFKSRGQIAEDLASYPGLKPYSTRAQRKARSGQVANFAGENIDRESLQLVADEMARKRGGGASVELNQMLKALVGIGEIQASNISGLFRRVHLLESRKENE